MPLISLVFISMGTFQVLWPLVFFAEGQKYVIGAKREVFVYVHKHRACLSKRKTSNS